MGVVRRSDLVIEVREYGHLEHLTHVSDDEIKRRLDRAYRRLVAQLDQARGHELVKREAVAHVAPGQRLVLLPGDFHQLRGLLLQRSTSVVVSL